MNKVSKDKNYAKQLMNAAQQSKTEQVKQLVKNSGVTQAPTIYYTPGGLHLNFASQDQTAECCHLIVELRWR
ncbi:putative outer membrane protein [Oikeobacillus pervagus]|uniref:Outer membrane protein n=1 Tax=Oikeobacillus pervagus TaxID=1325931 RepID=A0AAJ1WKF2_9BACI|nr:hypothetical protein [Oikeobacillus pervagus]MDQ0216538.1 putative outer membrane protein [Oikeobacillus pervagus]